MSRRCGIGIPSSSLANDSTGSVFVMSRPQANAKNDPSPPIGAPTGGETEGLGEASWNVAGPLLQFDGRALRFELLLDFFSLNASISSANSNTDMFPMASRMSPLLTLV